MEEKAWIKYLKRSEGKSDKKKRREARKLQKDEENKKKIHDDRLKKRRESRKEKSINSAKDSLLKSSDSEEAWSGRHRQKYLRYSEALKSEGILDELKILLDQQDFIIVRNSEVAKRLGKRFAQRSPLTIYWALKYVLFHEGIVCQLRKHKSDIGKTGSLLFMRKRRDEDCLAQSLET